MRKLNTSDAFRLCRLLKKANLKNELTMNDIAFKGTPGVSLSKSTIEEKGLRFMMILIDSAANEEVETEFYGFLGDVAERGAEEIKRQSPKETMDLIKEIAKENDLGNFFGTVGLPTVT